MPLVVVEPLVSVDPLEPVVSVEPLELVVPELVEPEDPLEPLELLVPPEDDFVGFVVCTGVAFCVGVLAVVADEAVGVDAGAAEEDTACTWCTLWWCLTFAVLVSVSDFGALTGALPLRSS